MARNDLDPHRLFLQVSRRDKGVENEDPCAILPGSFRNAIIMISSSRIGGLLIDDGWHNLKKYSTVYECSFNIGTAYNPSFITSP